MIRRPSLLFFFNDTAPTEIYTLSLHDALPILRNCWSVCSRSNFFLSRRIARSTGSPFLSLTSDISPRLGRSEEHTSESQSNLVCRLLLEKKKKNNNNPPVLDAQIQFVYMLLYC